VAKVWASFVVWSLTSVLKFGGNRTSGQMKKWAAFHFQMTILPEFTHCLECLQMYHLLFQCWFMPNLLNFIQFFHHYSCKSKQASEQVSNQAKNNTRDLDKAKLQL
jgi:hypothetical protein